MIEQQVIASALGGLMGWLEGWRDDRGAYQGFVVHRTETKRMHRVHDTAWTQAAMIRGYGNLYRKQRDPRWGESMTLAADLLASRFDPRTGRLRHTGHEDERFQSLVSCALGLSALLSIADLVDSERRARYAALAVDHVRRYWFERLWVPDEGAFKFTEVDYYSPDEDRFVVNFNTMAAEALLALDHETGGEEFRQRALAVGDWLLERWAHTRQVNEALLAEHTTVADDPAALWMPPGGFSYQFTAGDRKPDNYVTLYAGLSLRGFKALYDATADERWAEIIRAQAGYILAMRDPDTRLFYHTAWCGRIEKNPQFVAGAGMTLVGLHEVQPLIGAAAIPADTVRAALDRAHPNASYPGFIGKNDTGRAGRDGGGVVWEDVVASPNWNAQFFEYLSRLVEDPAEIEVPASAPALHITTGRFDYSDDPATARIVSWWPPRSAGIYVFAKKAPVARLSVYPVNLYRRLRSLTRSTAP